MIVDVAISVLILSHRLVWVRGDIAPLGRVHCSFGLAA